MEISTTFTILLPADEAYRFLLDLEQVAPCVPGGELGPAAADGTYPANVTVRLGPMRLGYSGSLWISEQDAKLGRGIVDDVARRLVVEMAACLEQRLGDRGAGWEAQAAAAPQILGIKLLLHVVAERLGRFGRKGDR